MELETTFYILGIIFMSVMLLITLIILVTALRIKAKIDAAHDVVSSKIEVVKNVAGKAGIAFKTVRYFIKARS